MHNGWLMGCGNHPVCIRVKKALKNPPSMYTAFCFYIVYVRGKYKSTRYTYSVVFTEKTTPNTVQYV